MSAAELLGELETIGASVCAHAGQLRIKAPAGTMTPELVARVKAEKPALMAILNGRVMNTEPATDPPGLERCAAVDSVIRQVCAANQFTDDIRETMLAARRRMSCDTVAAIMLEPVEWAERAALVLIRRVQKQSGL